MEKINSIKLSPSFSGALRTFAYFMASGTHYNLKEIDYLSLYGTEPSAIEKKPLLSLPMSLNWMKKEMS